MPEQPSKYYDKVFLEKEAYHIHWKQTKYADLYEALVALLWEHKIKSVLDIGCGTAQLGTAIVESGIRYSGFDFSPVGVSYGKKAGLNVWVGNALDEDNYLQAVDAYICTEALEHISEDFGVIENIVPQEMVFFSVPVFNHISHVRFFKTEAKVRDRYGKYFTDLNIQRIGKRFLAFGRRNDNND